ncbi:MAG TPA: ferritin family protein [Clostridiales bacterium]|nr:ferritin family protein [Clostridiales bacterium]
MAQNNFNDLEALEIAIQIENRGHTFYSKAAHLATSDGVREMLEKLAEQELDHASAFQKIYNELSQRKDSLDDTYLYDPEVSAYLKAMAESTIFPSDDYLNEFIDGLKDISDVLKIGIQAEKDSILFYAEMIINARYVEAKEAFRRLLKEEKKHLIDLQRSLDEYKSKPL